MKNKRFALLIAISASIGMLIIHFKIDPMNAIITTFPFKSDLDCKSFEKYKQECVYLLKDINNPKPDSFHMPPLREVPNELIDEFTQNGDMPIIKLYYFNDAYADSNMKRRNRLNEIVTRNEVESLRGYNLKPTGPFPYNNTIMRELMMKYAPNYLSNKTTVVIGTRYPWVEAIALDAQCSKITTLDYTRKEYEQSDVLEWKHVKDYLNDVIQTEQIEEFDSAASFSSIEHLGLGRYGDPLDPNGDIKAVKQVHCMIKQGGLFFLGLPTSYDNTSYIEFNAHRVYGYKRLRKLLIGWDILETKSANGDSVFVLRKQAIEC